MINSLPQWARISLLIGIGLTILAMFNQGHAGPAQLSLSCTTPTTRTDGTALPASEIAGYKFYGIGSKTVTSPVVKPCAYLYTIAEGTCAEAADNWTATAIDTAGLESGMSNWVTVGVKTCTPPKSPQKPVAPGAVKITPIPAT